VIPNSYMAAESETDIDGVHKMLRMEAVCSTETVISTYKSSH
jgi:hypothetical protein